MFEDDFADKFLFGLIGGRVTLSSMNKPGDWGPPFAWEGLYFILIMDFVIKFLFDDIDKCSHKINFRIFSPQTDTIQGGGLKMIWWLLDITGFSPKKEWDKYAIKSGHYVCLALFMKQ